MSKLGFQLYSARNFQPFSAIFPKLANAGYTEVEGYGALYGALALILTQALSTVVSSAFVAPFSSSVASLQYVDLRMRKEGYDVELMTRAGVLGS